MTTEVDLAMTIVWSTFAVPGRSLVGPRLVRVVDGRFDGSAKVRP
jgi:hypothetical protein